MVYNIKNIGVQTAYKYNQIMVCCDYWYNKYCKYLHDLSTAISESNLKSISIVFTKVRLYFFEILSYIFKIEWYLSNVTYTYIVSMYICFFLFTLLSSLVRNPNLFCGFVYKHLKVCL